MNTSCRKAALYAIGCLACSTQLLAFAQITDSPSSKPIPDKSRYTIFNPTPRDLMREMETDRPDLTETPYSVDAGHFQIEMDFVGFGYDRDKSGGENLRTEQLGVALINLKAGLLNNLDFQLMIESWVTRRTRDKVTGTSTRQSGFGDITPRLKLNLWGNDGGPTAAALMPFVKIPTNQDDVGNDAVEGGLILPFAVGLPWDFGLGIMPEFDIMEDEDGSGYHLEYVQTVALGRDIIGPLGAYVEFFSLLSTDSDADWIASFDFGFSYTVTRDLRFDAGVNIGVTDAAEDWNPFLGVSFRF